MKKTMLIVFGGITWSWDDDAGKGCGAKVGGCLSVRSQNSSGRLRLTGLCKAEPEKRKVSTKESRKIIYQITAYLAGG
jgi:hypothetical protein